MFLLNLSMLTTYPQTYLCMHKRQDKLRIAAKLASYRDLTTHALDDGFRQGKTDSDTVRIDLFVDTIETFENIFSSDSAMPQPSSFT